MIKKFKEFVDEGLLRHYNRWHNGEQRKEDQHEYVDLGLPSGLLWAKCNLGADTEVDYGGYYAWGETEEKDNYFWDTYKFGDYNNFTKYNKEDGLITLEPEDDVVHVNWGGKWRMPTKEEFKELIRHTTSEWIRDYNGTGVNGRLFTSKTNDNTLFFPAAGYKNGSSVNYKGSSFYVWSSSLYEYFSYDARLLYSRSAHVYLNHLYRCYGLSVRGVMEK